MSKAQHTPGPWHIADAHHGEKVSIECKENTFVALVDHRGTFGMQMANASLIAAAPELLEALEIALPYVQALHDNISAAMGHENTPVLGNLEKIRASLAKSKGE